MIKQIYNWLTTSSADPLKTSATVKGVLKVAVAEVLRHASTACSLGIVCIADGDAEAINSVIEATTAGLAGILYVWGAVQGAYGAYRKWKFGRWTAA